MRPSRPSTIRYDCRMSTIRTLTRISILASCALTGCVYRMPIQQGNYLDPVVIAQIKPGMTHSQVRYLLGTPMLPEAFDDSRWDYSYYLKTQRLRKTETGHVGIYFAHDLVARVDSDVTRAPFAPIAKRPSTAPEPRGYGGH
jgi:outer membrane protein assembly factor BamE